MIVSVLPFPGVGWVLPGASQEALFREQLHIDAEATAPPRGRLLPGKSGAQLERAAGGFSGGSPRLSSNDAG